MPPILIRTVILLFLLQATLPQCSAYCDTCSSGSNTSCSTCPTSFTPSTGTCTINSTAYPLFYESTKGNLSGLSVGTCGSFASIPGIYPSLVLKELLYEVAIPNHIAVRVRVSLLFVDYWENTDKVQILIDSLPVANGFYGGATDIGDICSQSAVPEKYAILDTSVVSHTSPTLNVSAQADECDCPLGVCKSCGWMLPEIIIMVVTCHPYCALCVGPSQNECGSCNNISTTEYLLSGTTCDSSCLSGYYKIAPNLCFPCILGCTTCTAMGCSICNTTGYWQLSGFTCNCMLSALQIGNDCHLCTDYIDGCSECSSTTSCTTCDTAGHWMTSGLVCACVGGYAQSETQCVLCSSSLVGCTSCSSTTTCTGCDGALHWTLSGGVCVCASGYADNSGVCVTCSQTLAGCMTCNSTSNCTTCNTANYMMLDATSRQCYCNSADFRTQSSNSCICMPRYFDAGSAACQACSSGCLSCSSLAICTACDTANHWRLDLQNCICEDGYTGSSCLACSSFMAGCTNCSSQTVCTLCEAGQNWVLSGSVCACKNGTSLQNSACVDSANNNSSNTKTESEQSVRVVVFICDAIGLTTLVIGLPFWKLIGLEAMNMLQIMFFSMSLMTFMHPTLLPITELYNSVNGYNNMFSNFPGLFNFNDPKMPQMLSQMHVGARFLQNINYMLLLEGAVFAFGLIFFIISFLFPTVHDFFLKMCKFILTEFLLFVVIFNSMNFGFCLGLHFLYILRPQTQSTQSHLLNLIPAFVGLLITAGSCLMVIKYNKFFEHNNTVLNKDSFSKYHPVTLCCYRLVFGVLIGALQQFAQAGLLLFVLQIGYLIFVAVRQPYKEPIVMIRGVVNEAVVCLIIYNIQVVNSTSDANKSRDTLWLEIAIIFIVMIFNLGCSIFGIYRTIRPNSQKVVQTQPVLNETIENFNDQLEEQEAERKKKQDVSISQISRDVSYQIFKPPATSTSERKIKSSRKR